jgi:hypothetical protein
MVIDSVVLSRLTTRDLPAIVGWFQDRDRSRFLGGPDWPAAMLANADGPSGRISVARGRPPRIISSRSPNGAPVGYVDCGTFDRCAVYGGEGQHGPIILQTIESIAGAIAFTVDPAGGKGSRSR